MDKDKSYYRVTLEEYKFLEQAEVQIREMMETILTLREERDELFELLNLKERVDELS